MFTAKQEKTVTKILEITLLEAIKARAQLRARNWIIKRESNGKTYIVHINLILLHSFAFESRLS